MMSRDFYLLSKSLEQDDYLSLKNYNIRKNNLFVMLKEYWMLNNVKIKSYGNYVVQYVRDNVE